MQQKDLEKLAQGTVIESLPATTFRVQIGEDIVLCHLSGKMRMYRIRVYPGDSVSVKLSPDGKRGIVMRRG